MQISNAQPEWMKFMADLETEEPEPRIALVRDDVRLMAGQVAIFPELFDMLEKAHGRLPEDAFRLQVGALLARAWDYRK